MDEHAENLSFGRYLQTARLEKGFGLDRVSEMTRIRRETLVCIENEDYPKLPDDVFVKGFVRAFAKAVGADSDEAIRRYVSRRALFDAVSQSEEFVPLRMRKFWLKLFAAFAGVGLICFLSVYLFSYSYNEQPAVPPVPTAPAPVPTAPSPAAEPATIQSHDRESIDTKIVATVPPAPPMASETVVIPQKHVLQMRAIEETWLKIIVDEMEPMEYSLKPGDEMRLEALKRFDLLVGNAGGLRMEFDNEEISIPGKSGDVVNLRLPEI